MYLEVCLQSIKSHGGIFEKWNVGVQLYEIPQVVLFLYPVGTRQPTMYHQKKMTLIFDVQ